MKITATYRIVTPMFIGDAEQKATSIRPPSIKGALRFWWRACQWGKMLQETQGDVSSALHTLHQREAKLFGIAAEDNRGGQGRFLLQVIEQPKRQTQNNWPQNNTGSGYLGFGLFESGKPEKGNYQPHREAIVENSHFTLQLCFKPKASEEDINSLRETLKVFGLLGGLGSRARRGFGSVYLETLDEMTITDSKESYTQKITQLINLFNDVDFPPYTAFSSHTRFAVIAEEKNARDVHSQAGNAYKNHRGQPSSLRGQAKLPFGLPLPGVDEERRRSSPLLFHIHPLKDNTFVASVLYLPADFHPHYPQENLAHFYQLVRQFIPQGNPK
jgi:CRISPR-associated protein Cmr1